MSRPTASRRATLARRMIAELDTLTDRERLVLAMLLVERLTVLEAAGAMRISMREVGEVYATALQRLARGTGAHAQRKAA